MSVFKRLRDNNVKLTEMDIELFSKYGLSFNLGLLADTMEYMSNNDMKISLYRLALYFDQVGTVLDEIQYPNNRK